MRWRCSEVEGIRSLIFENIATFTRQKGTFMFVAQVIFACFEIRVQMELRTERRVGY